MGRYAQSLIFVPDGVRDNAIAAINDQICSLALLQQWAIRRPCLRRA